MNPTVRRRAVLRTGVGVTRTSLAGCLWTESSGPSLSESFESGMERWSTEASIGPEVSKSDFEWIVERSRERAADGDWSLSVFTEGDHDDGTAWAVTRVSAPDEVETFTASLQAWSPSESFNTLRHLVAYLGPEPPTDEESFPEPGVNSSAFDDAAPGGFREPLHLAEGWREYTFDWQPSSIPDELYFAVGVSVVWEADATHFVDDIEIVAE